jgi:AraC-like DNA-binding protein
MYIDKYYLVEIESPSPLQERRIFAEGCMDFVINVGDGNPLMENSALQPGQVYLSGIMNSVTSFKNLTKNSFLGIKFKPGGLAQFTNTPMSEYSNKLTEYEDPKLKLLIDLDVRLTSRLDKHFLSKMKDQKSVSPIINHIRHHQGKVSIKSLTEKFAIADRTLERIFNRQVGVAPKEFTSLIRFQAALGRILRKSSNELRDNLEGLAFDSGFYDHAHFTREVKRFTGSCPTDLIKLDESTRLFIADFFF